MTPHPSAPLIVDANRAVVEGGLAVGPFVPVEAAVLLVTSEPRVATAAEARLCHTVVHGERDGQPSARQRPLPVPLLFFGLADRHGVIVHRRTRHAGPIGSDPLQVVVAGAGDGDPAVGGNAPGVRRREWHDADGHPLVPGPTAPLQRPLLEPHRGDGVGRLRRTVEAQDRGGIRKLSARPGSEPAHDVQAALAVDGPREGEQHAGAGVSLTDRPRLSEGAVRSDGGQATVAQVHHERRIAG